LLKTEGLAGRAYLEMWCRFPGRSEFLSRGLDHAVTGPNDWVPCQTRCFLKAGEKPDLVRLNLVVEGRGKVLIKDVVLAKAPSQAKPSFDEAWGAAVLTIASREDWPPSPEALCKAFWEARARKDYRELEVLWPGSASFGWEEICRKDSNVKYVFGAVKDDEVPYTWEEYYREHGSYNMTMRLHSFETPKGLRYYIVSGN
jgi:hypothetical protein